MLLFEDLIARSSPTPGKNKSLRKTLTLSHRKYRRLFRHGCGKVQKPPSLTLLPGSCPLLKVPDSWLALLVYCSMGTPFSGTQIYNLTYLLSLLLSNPG